MDRRMLMVFLAAGVAVLAGHGATASPASVNRGHKIAEQACSPCHAVGSGDASPNPGSPALRTLRGVLPGKNLEETVAEGTQSGHFGMPIFGASPDQIQDLIDYLKTIQVRQDPNDL